jgi:hypothetical protein
VKGSCEGELKATSEEQQSSSLSTSVMMRNMATYLYRNRRTCARAVAQVQKTQASSRKAARIKYQKRAAGASYVEWQDEWESDLASCSCAQGWDIETARRGNPVLSCPVLSSSHIYLRHTAPRRVMRRRDTWTFGIHTWPFTLRRLRYSEHTSYNSAAETKRPVAQPAHSDTPETPRTPEGSPHSQNHT